MSKTGNAGGTLAFDRASARTYDQDGHLHVARTPISKANVCPYYGREIPDWEALGLNPDRLYQLLRDPEELAKAAATFAGKPLLNIHRPVTADDHEHEAVAGSVSNPIWEAPYLKADLAIWDGPAIKAVEAETQKELSSAYRYRADMTPGSFEGVRYDGVMRDLIGNHVALVKEGRAGPDVVVGDQKPANIKDQFDMPKATLSRGAAAAHAALAVYLRPKLAQDAKIDLASVLAKVTSANFGAQKPAIIAGVKKQAEGKLAQDASLDDIGEVVEALAQIIPAEVPEAAADDGDDDDEGGGASDDDDADLRSLLKAKGLSDEEIARICSGNAAAMDSDDDKDKVTKTAMDAAIAAAVTSATKSATAAAVKTQQDIREAERVVRPYVGDLAMAHDSADAVYRTALTTLGVDVGGVHPSAFPAILKLQQKPGDTPPARKPIAQDAAASKAFEERFPHANRLKV